MVISSQSIWFGKGDRSGETVVDSGDSELYSGSEILKMVKNSICLAQRDVPLEGSWDVDHDLIMLACSSRPASMLD
jgi:hypothetical protein